MTLRFMTAGLTTVMLHRPKMGVAQLLLLCTVVNMPPHLAGSDIGTENVAQEHAGHHDSAAPAKLVELVRAATRQYADVNVAAAGYGAFLGCVSGPDAGAMGVHYVNGTYAADSELNPSRPEALIHEPTPESLRLVGVEFIVDAAKWFASHTNPAVLEGQTFHYVGSPNRFGLPAFFELHFWAWRHNPNGAFVDWNTRVTCQRQ
jgi:hypothetical protein